MGNAVRRARDQVIAPMYDKSYLGEPDMPGTVQVGGPRGQNRSIPDAILSLRKQENVFTRIALSNTFDTTVLVIIILNAFWIGFEVDSNDADVQRIGPLHVRDNAGEEYVDG